MTRYFVDVDDELAQKLKQVNEQDIIEVLTKLAEKETSSDELASYDSVTSIREDDSLTSAERKRLELKAKRRSGFDKR
jgi:DNA polymerase III alpha subunit (gram-positive type)